MVTDLYTTTIADTVDNLQDVGREVFIAGFSADGRRALVVDWDNDRVSIASVDACGTLGRWECSVGHFHDYRDLYESRFPQR